MTLIANYSFENHPFIIGDIMLSSKNNGSNLESFSIPTRMNVNAIIRPETGYIVSGWSQKVIQLSKRLIVAWAGNALTAYKVTKDLYGEENHITFDMIENKLNDWQIQSGLSYLYIIGIYISNWDDEKSELTFFDWDSRNGFVNKYYDIPNYGKCYFGGSGSAGFREILQRNIISNISDNCDKFNKGLLVSLSHLALMIGEQMRLGFGVNQLFGGGYECATFANGHLQKVSDISYHFWDAQSLESEKLNLGMVAILKISYFEDYLLIRKLKLSSNGNKVKNELYVIRPPYRIITDSEKQRIESELIWPELTSSRTVFYVNFPNMTKGHKKVCSFANISGSDNIPVNYEINDDSINIVISPDIIQRIIDELDL